MSAALTFAIGLVTLLESTVREVPSEAARRRFYLTARKHDVMPKKVGFGKREREMLSNSRLPPDMRVAVIEFKTQIRVGRGLIVYENRDDGLPAAAVGQTYYEYQVGHAHAGDERPRGKRRLVALVDAGQNIVNLYFTDSHYTLGEWKQLQYT